MEKQAARDIQLPDEDAEIGPVPTDGGGQKPEPEMDRLSNIVRDFNDRFGNVEWKDQDKIEKAIFEELPAKVARQHAHTRTRWRTPTSRTPGSSTTRRCSTPSPTISRTRPSCSSSSATTSPSAAGSPKRYSPSHIADRRLLPAPHDPGRVSRMGAMHMALP